MNQPIPQLPIPSIYFDQNVYGRILDDGNGDWRKSEMGALLDQAQTAKRVALFVSPANVQETLLCAEFDDVTSKLTAQKSSKLDKRNQLAKFQLAACGTTRMLPSPDLIVIGELIQTLAAIAPASVPDDFFFREQTDQIRREYLGILALLSAESALDRPEAVTDIIRSKLVSNLLHAGFLASPEDFAAKITQCSDEWSVTRDDPLKKYDQLSFATLKGTTDALKVAAKKIDPATKKQLQRDKKKIARAYGAAEIGGHLMSVLPHSAMLNTTFDFDVIRENLKLFQDKLKASIIVPKEVALAKPMMHEHEIILLESVFRAFAQNGLLSSYIGNLVLLSELEICLNNGTVPSAGLTFDTDHVLALLRCNLYVTFDEYHANLANRASNEINEKCKGKWQTKVIGDSNGLIKTLKDLAKTN